MSAAVVIMMALHVAAGAVALVAGTIAVVARKGRRVHRSAGVVFAGGMIVMGVFADILAVVVPGQLPNLFVGTLAIYLVSTGWMTMQPRTKAIVWAERSAFGLILLLCAPFLLICGELATGAPLFFKTAFAIKGPILIALNVFTAIVLLGAAIDARTLLSPPLGGRARVGRHLWRMTLGLAFAAGSAFTNGLPRLLPKPLPFPFGVFFIPQLVVLALMIFWMIRINFPPWSGRATAGATAGSA